jgi:tetratricopeptide (TPR) repeat protein
MFAPTRSSLSKNPSEVKRLLTAALLTIVILAVGVVFLMPKKPELAKKPTSGRMEIRGFWDAYNRATQLRSEKKFEEAIVYYKKALQTKPLHEESLYYLAGSLLEIGEDRAAIETYETILKQNPRSTRALSQLGILLSADTPAHRADPVRAEEMFQRVLKVNQEESGPYVRLGLLALHQQDPEKAFRYFETAAGFKSPEGIFFCGYVRYSQRKYKEAIAFFTRVLQINEQEKKISGRGVFSEGDVQSASGAPLSMLEKTGLRALLFLYWSAEKLGGYPGTVPGNFRLQPGRQDPAKRIRVALAPLEQQKNEPVNLPATLQVSGTVTRVIESDYNRDGAPDLLLLRWKRPLQLFRNTGNQNYVDVTASANLQDLGNNSLAAVFADIDADQLPDLFLTEHAPYERALQCLVDPRIRWNDGVPRLFRNLNGTGFQQGTPAPGLHHAYGTMDAAAVDVNGDGWIDLVLANGGPEPWRMEPSVALINQQGKGFLQSEIPSLEEPLNAHSISLEQTPQRTPSIRLHTKN